MTIKGFFVGILKYSLFIFSLMMVGALSTFITVRLFTSGDTVVVPDLTGKDATEAIKVLNDQGLQLKIHPQKRISDAVAADKIAAQTPQAKTKIKQGRSVEVYLSLGPEKIIVPDLAGQSSRVALLTLTQRGLHQGKAIFVRAHGVDTDHVIAQFPPPGTEMSRSRTVNILVNNAPKDSATYMMPDVVGRKVKAVTRLFLDAGLRVGSSFPVDYPGIEPGTIVKQAPLPGYKVAKETFITIYYSKMEGEELPQQPETQTSPAPDPTVEGVPAPEDKPEEEDIQQ